LRGDAININAQSQAGINAKSDYNCFENAYKIGVKKTNNCRAKQSGLTNADANYRRLN
jgi:hypothetical protein